MKNMNEIDIAITIETLKGCDILFTEGFRIATCGYLMTLYQAIENAFVIWDIKVQQQCC